MNVSQQPRSAAYAAQTPQMPIPQAAIGNVPPGLEYLTQVDQLLIHQQVELLEAFTGFHCKNRYEIKNSIGQRVYFAAEESSTLMRLCCGTQRGFTFHITDNFGKEVFRVTRQFKCCVGCVWCIDCCLGCAFLITVSTPDGAILGYARQMQSCCATRLEIQDGNGKKIFEVLGPTCICQCVCLQSDVKFKIFTNNTKEEVGSLNKQWGGFAREAFTNASNFSASFPMDLDVKLKATLLGTVLLVDMINFERKNNDY